MVPIIVISDDDESVILFKASLTSATEPDSIPSTAFKIPKNKFVIIPTTAINIIFFLLSFASVLKFDDVTLSLILIMFKYLLLPLFKYI